MVGGIALMLPLLLMMAGSHAAEGANPIDTAPPSDSKTAGDGDSDFMNSLVNAHWRDAKTASPVEFPLPPMETRDYVIKESCRDVLAALRKIATPIFNEGIGVFKDTIEDVRKLAVKRLNFSFKLYGYKYVLDYVGRLHLWAGEWSNFISFYLRSKCVSLTYASFARQFIYSNNMLLANETPREFLVGFAGFFDSYIGALLRDQAFKLDCYIQMENKNVKAMNCLLEKICSEVSAAKAVDSLYKEKPSSEITWDNCAEELQAVMYAQFEAFFNRNLPI